MNDALINQVHCLEFSDMCARLPDKSVDMTLCDIPYGQVNQASSGLRVLNKGIADIVTFDLHSIVCEMVRISKYWVYVFCSTEQVSLIRGTLQSAGMMTRLCVYHKTSPTPLNGEYMWLSDIECCVVGRKQGAVFNQFCTSSVWRFPAGTRELHPTQKNLDLFEYLIQSSTNKGDLVFDGFCGSGTTALASVNTGRNFICSDFMQEYVDIARKRLQDADPYAPTQVSATETQLSLLGLLGNGE